MTPEQATIRRATRVAQRAVVSLDAAGRRELARAYRAAAEDLKALIAAYAGPDEAVRLAQLQDLLGQVNARLARLAGDQRAVIDEGLTLAAQYGARVFAADDMALMTRVSEGALLAVQAFVAADGLQLSDRIWRVDRQAREAVTQALERAVIEGESALQAARRFLSRGERVPSELAAKLGGPNAARLGSEAAAQLTGNGRAMDNAMRVFRTEINRAHGEAYMAGGEGRPYFGGWRFKLSPAHPEHDICDLYAAQNAHGLGPGVYPSRSKCPWPAHPNTLSFVEIVFKDEITDADRAGQETPMQALTRLPAEVRRGVLGKNKAEAFDAGLLSQGMIKSRWRDVERRIGRE